MLGPRGLRLRSRMLWAVRTFFLDRDYLEVDTPIRLPVLIPEAQIEPVASGCWWLQTSPEQCMKRLLARGAERIFQVCPCFRKGESGGLHSPEFTLLEWYQVGHDYRDLMDECEMLFVHLADRCWDFPGVGPDQTLIRDGRSISLKPPWARMSVDEAFRRWGGVDVDQALAEDRFDEILVERIEPNLGWDRPLFLHDYPLPLASLARPRPNHPELAERVELYVAGIELANGFSELVDPVMQRRRFEREIESIRNQGRNAKLPERFLDDLERMPPCAGIALGVDRLFLLLMGASALDQVLPFSRADL